MKVYKSETGCMARIGLCCAKAGVGHWIAPGVGKAAATLAVTQTTIRINEMKDWLESFGDLGAVLLPVARDAERGALMFFGAGA